MIQEEAERSLHLCKIGVLICIFTHQKQKMRKMSFCVALLFQAAKNVKDTFDEAGTHSANECLAW